MFTEWAITEVQVEPLRQASQPKTTPSRISAGKRTGSRWSVANRSAPAPTATTGPRRMARVRWRYPRKAISSHTGASRLATSAMTTRSPSGASKSRPTSKRSVQPSGMTWTHRAMTAFATRNPAPPDQRGEAEVRAGGAVEAEVRHRTQVRPERRRDRGQQEHEGLAPGEPDGGVEGLRQEAGAEQEHERPEEEQAALVEERTAGGAAPGGGHPGGGGPGASAPGGGDAAGSSCRRTGGDGIHWRMIARRRPACAARGGDGTPAGAAAGKMRTWTSGTGRWCSAWAAGSPRTRRASSLDWW